MIAGRRSWLGAAAGLALAASAPGCGTVGTVPERRRFTASDGAGISYLQAGRGGLTLLLVPGFLADAALFGAQIEHFARSRRVLAVDPRGQGQSPAPLGSLGPQRRVADYAELLQQEGVRRCVVLGWSMACAEALSLYGQLGPERIRALVLVDGFIGEDASPQRQARVEGWMDWLASDRKSWTDAYLGPGMFKQAPAATVQRVRAVADATPAAAAREIMLSHYALDRRPLVQGVKVPLLYLRQQPAPDAEPDQTWLALQAAGQRRMQQWPDAAHAMFVDQPARFNDVVAAFLADVV